MAQQFLTQEPRAPEGAQLEQGPQGHEPWRGAKLCFWLSGDQALWPCLLMQPLLGGSHSDRSHSLFCREYLVPAAVAPLDTLAAPHQPSLPAQLAVFYFQVFLSYTVAGSSFVFGDTLVADVFAFQVNSTLGAKGVGGRCQGCGCGSVGAVQQAAQPGSRCGPRAWEGLSHTPAE